MCTMGLALAVTTVISATSAVMQGVSSNQQAKAAQDAAEYNEEMSVLKAKDALQRGDEAVRQQRWETQQILANISMTSPYLDKSSPLYSQLYDDRELWAMLDAEMTLENANREAWGHYSQGELYGMEADSARTAGKTAIATSVIGGASAVAEGFYTYKKEIAPA